jgi:hypothetical protein
MRFPSWKQEIGLMSVTLYTYEVCACVRREWVNAVNIDRARGIYNREAIGGERLFVTKLRLLEGCRRLPKGRKRLG